MAGDWRTDPSIQLAKHVCQQKQAKGAIIIWFTSGQAELDGVKTDVPGMGFGGASYGVNGSICKEAGDVLDQIIDAIETSGYIDIVGLCGAIEKK